MSRTCSTRAARPFSAGLALALGLVLSACGTGFFGISESPEPPLPGERVSLRETGPEVALDQASAAAYSQLPAPVAIADWTHVNAVPTHAPGHLVGPSSLNLAWSADVGDGDESARITSAPIVANGLIYVIDGEGVVTATSASDGSRRWEADLAPEGEGGEDGFGGGVAYADGVVFAATGFGEVVALTASDGAELWRRPLGAPMRAAPTVSNGRVHVVTRDNGAFTLSAEDGSVIWRMQGSAGTLGLLGGASPAAVADALILPFASGEVMGAMDLTEPHAGSALGSITTLFFLPVSIPVRIALLIPGVVFFSRKIQSSAEGVDS